MEYCWYFTAWALAFLGSLRCTLISNVKIEGEIMEDDPFLLRVVQNTMRISRAPTVHVSNHASHRSATSLLRSFHESHIPTTIGYKSIRAEQSPKTIMFLLDGCHDILSLIFGSVLERNISVVESEISVVESTDAVIESTHPYTESECSPDHSNRTKMILKSSIVETRNASILPRSLTIASEKPNADLKRSVIVLKSSDIESKDSVIEPMGSNLDLLKSVTELRTSTAKKSNSVRELRSLPTESKSYTNESKNLTIQPRNLIAGSMSSSFELRNTAYKTKRNVVPPKRTTVGLRSTNLKSKGERYIPRRIHDTPEEFSLQNICFDYHNSERTVRYGDPSKTCDHLVQISEEDFHAGSEFPTTLLRQTRDLFHHPVWNSANYLIFRVQNRRPERMCLDVDGSQHHEFDLLLSFKIMWRFFRSFKTVMCFAEQCFNYRPFDELIVAYTMASGDYFDFSWSNVQSKRLLVQIYSRDDADIYLGLSHRPEVGMFVLETVAEKLNTTVIFHTPSELDEATLDNDDSDGDVFDVAVKGFQGIEPDPDSKLKLVSVLSEELDLRLLLWEADFHLGIAFWRTATILHRLYLLMWSLEAVPERGYMPSYLIPAKCFTPIVWLFILGSISLCAFVHEAYRRISGEEASTIFTIYSYVLCVGHSRLLIGTATGKILFVILSFTCLILSSVFLSRMTESISKKLRYDPIDTAAQLEASDLLFQMEPDLGEYLFTSDPKYVWINNRSIDSWRFYRDVRRVFAAYPDPFEWGRSRSLLDLNMSEVASRSLARAETEILNNDGFILFVPLLTKWKDLFYAPDYRVIFGTTEFHIVKEPVMTYPFDLRLLSNSVYGPKIKSIAIRLAEAGIMTNAYEKILGRDWLEMFRQYEEVYANEPLRPFGMVDLQIGFIVLIVGWTISAFVFIAELFYTR
ncbi:unnamed protein product [Bemisia tabaci]|uniref:Ionotropic receptor n=1 Tax=Bemisia tabaci TaxID=7038 RepID=A0A9P0AJD2_BEMTA|nr:unnamed protein product [Bemisia tabaci]